MVTRRQFLHRLVLSLLAAPHGWSGALPAWAGSPASRPTATAVKIALLADAHLPDARPDTAAAQNLLAAVTAINGQNPPVDLVVCLGDISDTGSLGALHLGKEILASLRAPCWALPGEKDRQAGRPWARVFGGASFSFRLQGWHFLGLDTLTAHSADGEPHFHLTPALQERLAKDLNQIPPEVPLLIFSHGPLYRLFQPWHWWTQGAESLPGLLAGRDKVFLFNGHVHQNLPLQHRNLVFQGVRATAWPYPDVRMGCFQGEPFQPGRAGRSGCGWMLLTANGAGNLTLEDMVWQL